MFLFGYITVGICWLLLIVPHDQMVGSVNAGYPHLLVCIIIEPHHTNMCCSTHPVLVCTPTIVIPNVFDLILPCVGWRAHFAKLVCLEIPWNPRILRNGWFSLPLSHHILMISPEDYTNGNLGLWSPPERCSPNPPSHSTVFETSKVTTGDPP